ncbi:MAG: MFS transporter [Pseudomonadota bacterium]
MTNTTASTDEIPLAADSERVPETVTGGALGSKGIGWAIFEWARNPYYNVVVIYAFTPYFTANVIGDPGLGQTLIGVTIALAGVIMAFVAPVLGSIVDKAGAKKPLVALSLGTVIVCSLLLGFITPELPAAVPIGMALLLTAYCAYTVSELMHNAMLPGAGRTESLPMISGLGLSLGNAAGVIGLVTIVVLSQNPSAEIDVVDIGRLSAPAVGIWILVFIPLFFWLMPDVYEKGRTWGQAIREFLDPANRTDVSAWIRKRFQEHPNVMRYLIGRMIYADGIAALLTIGGVYVGGVLGWDISQLAIYGIIASVFAVFGGIFGGFLDRLLGPKRALILELSMAILIGIFQISITQESILFGMIPAGHEVLSTGPFRSLADVAYVSAVVPAAIFLVAAISSSRYMLLHISPPDKIGEFFGFYAMSGSVTVWLGPGSVALATWLSGGDQRIGFTPVVVLLTIGLLILLTVKADKTPEHMKTGA